MALQEMETGVSTLSKTVEDLESEADECVRSLENSIDAIEEPVKVIVVQCDGITMTTHCLKDND